MEEKRISEQESLVLIAKMIQQTKQNFQVGSGNMLLYYGYTCVVLSVCIYVICHFTQQMYWHSLWFLVFIPMLFEKFLQRKQVQEVVTYMDKAIENVWHVINALLVLTIVVIGLFEGVMPLILMMPLALLFVGIGTSCMGVITKDKCMTYFPVISFVTSIYMLVMLFVSRQFSLEWNLLAGLAFFTMLVVPGHVLNHKSLK